VVPGNSGELRFPAPYKNALVSAIELL
jgi:hypothetical protein